MNVKTNEARYINANALLENFKKQYGEDLGWQCTVNMSDVGMMIEDAPTADVVPRAEIAKIFENIGHFIKRLYYNADYTVFDMSRDIAELQKKYTEEKK